MQLKANRKLTDHEKLIVLTKHFIPPRSYKFAARFISGRNRHFQQSWLDQHNGLVYSESEDGGYCKYCVLFARDGTTMELGVFVNRPLIDFKRATEKLSDHFRNKKFHKTSVQAAATFTSVMKNPDLAIDHQLNSERSRLAAENHDKLSSIAETVIFCGRQGLAFRGRRDDTPSMKDDSCTNHGNFLALLHFRVQAGDQVLDEHLKTAAGNALYTSKTVQNEMITICGDIIREKLLKMVKKAGFFTVIADEATDVANDEQLLICVRFIDNGSPCEKFLSFYECQSGVTGEALADDILSKLVEWQLHPQLLCDQAYGGAGAMAGKSKGVASRILSKYPKALYTHCAAHRLNLCVMKCCSIREVSNMMQTADKISRFFSNSPKRQLALEQWIDNVLPEENRRKLKELCRTRWVKLHEAFDVFSDLFLPTFCCLEAIVYSPPSDWNRETRSDAQSLLAMSQFPFMVVLVLSQKVLAYTKGLSIKLQGRYIDVVRAHRDIESVRTTIKNVRSRVEDFHSEVYQEVLMLSQSVDVVEAAPRQASRQQHRQNNPSDNISDYYKRNLTIPILDHLSSELDIRFDADCSQNLIELLQLLPFATKTTSRLRVEKFSNLLQLYGGDLPSVKSFYVELDLWRNKWTGNPEQAQGLNTSEKVLAQTDYDYFPNIHTLIVVLATLPITSCECERSISIYMLKRVKTGLRSNMTESRLNGLALLQYHRNISVTADQVVQEFVRCHPRRLLMVNPFE